MHPYSASPKAILIAGPRCSGKTHTGERIARELGFTCISQDHVRLKIQEENGLTSQEMFDPKVRDLYKKEFMSRLREARYTDIVVEGARLSQQFVYTAFVEAYLIEYGQFGILKSFFIMPSLSTRCQRYTERLNRHAQSLDAELAKPSPDKATVESLAAYLTSPFDAFVNVPDYFEQVGSGDDVMNWIADNLTAIHPHFPQQHAALIEEISRSSSGYSPFYQTVDVGNERVVVGQTQSHLSWDNILKLGIDWNGKKVCEIGCNNGYFLFKAEALGATCHGFDINQGSIDAAKAIAKYTGSSCTFELCNVEQDYAEESDIVFALNMLHYMEDLPAMIETLSRKSRALVLEVGKGQLDDILPVAVRNGQRMVKTVPSHRKQSVIGERVILHMEKR